MIINEYTNIQLASERQGKFCVLWAVYVQTYFLGSDEKELEWAGQRLNNEPSAIVVAQPNISRSELSELEREKMQLFAENICTLNTPVLGIVFDSEKQLEGNNSDGNGSSK